VCFEVASLTLLFKREGNKKEVLTVLECSAVVQHKEGLGVATDEGVEFSIAH
jgi:hypothetical protein